MAQRPRVKAAFLCVANLERHPGPEPPDQRISALARIKGQLISFRV